MDACIFYILFLSSMFLSIDATEPICPAVKCSDDAPDIHFPFRVSGRQPQQCGHPGFQLFCKENITMLHFPSYGNLVVKSISYSITKLDLLDPKSCVHEVFLNLNLSLTPFQYYYVVKNYTYLNCSTRLSSSFEEVPCLSGPRHHVYTVESSFAVPVSCRPVKTIAIPFAYSPYLADNSFGLGLTWSLPGSEDCESKLGKCGFHSKAGPQTEYLNYIPQYKGVSVKHLILGENCTQVLKVFSFILAVITLVGIKIYHSKMQDGQMENEKLLKDRKTINH